MPAATEMSICLLFSFNSRITGSINHGLTARMTISAPVAASTLLLVIEIPGNSFFSFSSFPALGLDTMMSESSIRLPFARPRAIEPPIFPAPIILTKFCSLLASKAAMHGLPLTCFTTPLLNLAVQSVWQNRGPDREIMSCCVPTVICSVHHLPALTILILPMAGYRRIFWSGFMIRISISHAPSIIELTPRNCRA